MWDLDEGALYQLATREPELVFSSSKREKSNKDKSEGQSEAQRIVPARGLSRLRQDDQVSSSTRDLPRRVNGIAMRGSDGRPVIDSRDPTGYAFGPPRGWPIVSRVRFAGMNDPAPRVASTLEAFRC